MLVFEQGVALMDNHLSSGIIRGPGEVKKIYAVLIGSASMASLDALILSLDRFKNILSSESAQTSFETTVRSIQPTLGDVHKFIDAAYVQKTPTMTVTMTKRTLVIEMSLSESEFLECIHDQDITEILKQITAVGSMPAKKIPGQKQRDYTVFPVKYMKGNFIKL